MSTATVSSPKKTKGENVAARWDDQNSRILLEIMDAEINKGNRPAGIFTKSGWFNIVESFKEQTGCDYNKDQLKNRMDNLRRDFIKWEKLIGRETGLGWDHDKRTLAAPDSWWYEKAKADPTILKYKDGGPVNLDLLQKVFSGVCATGYLAYNPFTSDPDPLVHNGDRIEHIEDIIDFTAEVDGEQQYVGHTSPPTSVHSPGGTTPSSSKLRPQKRKRSSTSTRQTEIEKFGASVRSLNDTIRDGMVAYSRVKLMDIEKEAYDETLALLEELPGMVHNNPLYYKAIRVLEDKYRRVAFKRLVRAGEEAVIRWLETFPDF